MTRRVRQQRADKTKQSAACMSTADVWIRSGEVSLAHDGSPGRTGTCKCESQLVSCRRREWLVYPVRCVGRLPEQAAWTVGARGYSGSLVQDGCDSRLYRTNSRARVSTGSNHHASQTRSSSAAVSDQSIRATKGGMLSTGRAGRGARAKGAGETCVSMLTMRDGQMGEECKKQAQAGRFTLDENGRAKC